MGKIIFKGGASSKDFAIRETTAGEVEIVNESDDIIVLEADATSIKDAGGVQLSAHGSRHAFGGADALGADLLRYQQIKVVFGTQQTVTVTAGGTSTIAEGVYIARSGANTSVEYSPDGGASWYTLIAAGGTGIVFSDGTNVRFNNAGADDEDSYLLPVE